MSQVSQAFLTINEKHYPGRLKSLFVIRKH